MPKTDEERDWVHPCASFIELPFPAEIARLIQKLRTLLPDANWKQNLLPLFGPEVDDARKTLVWHLRDKVSPRITEQMLRGFLPATVFSETQTRQLCQMLTGESLGFSVAPLHYYAISQKKLFEQYLNALSALFPSLLEAPITYQEGAFFGAPLAVSRDDKVKRAVIGLRREAESSARRLTDTNTAIPNAQVRIHLEAVNSMVAYTAHMYIAAMAHRNTFWLEKLTRKSFDPDLRICVDRDKVCDAGHIARVCALPDLVFAQIDELVDCYDRLRQTLKDHLSDLDERVINPTLDRIDAAISGEGPLFLAFPIPLKRGPEPVDRDWLTMNFPQWKLPAHAFRPRLRHQLAERGVDPYEIDMQLGHYWGHQPFSSDSERSVPDFASRLRTSLTEQIKKDGWALLKCRRSKEGPDSASLRIECQRVLSLEPLVEQHREHAALAQRRGVARAEYFNPPKEDEKLRYQLDVQKLLINRDIDAGLTPARVKVVAASNHAAI
jgi:hypothetical protein